MYQTVGICILAIALLGCGTEGITSQNPSLVDTEVAIVDDLRVEVTVRPLTVEQGETLHIGISVTNTADTPVRMGFASGCIYGYAIRDTEGSKVAPPPRICTADAPIVTYAPGETVVQEFEWVYESPVIPPGRYAVSAGFGQSGEGGPPPVFVILE